VLTGDFRGVRGAIGGFPVAVRDENRRDRKERTVARFLPVSCMVSRSPRVDTTLPPV